MSGSPALEGSAPAAPGAAPDVAGADLGELDALLSSTGSSIEESREDVAVYQARLQADDRSRIAKLVVWLFMVACLGTVAFILLAVLTGYRAAEWDGGAERLIQILSSVILPVVTLVIGYYFGSEQRGERRSGG